MGIETSLYTVLTGDATIAALVGTRVRPEVGYPEEIAAQIAYTASEMPTVHSEGVAGPSRGSVRIECWGTTKAEADTLFAAVAAELDVGYPRTFGDVWMQAMRRNTGDASATSVAMTSENNPDFYLRTMEYFAAWQ